MSKRTFNTFIIVLFKPIEGKGFFRVGEKKNFYLIFSSMIFGFKRFINEQIYGTESNTVDELH